jgi:tetratricopeptide (TPR) repeat protein
MFLSRNSRLLQPSRRHRALLVTLVANAILASSLMGPPAMALSPMEKKWQATFHKGSEALQNNRYWIAEPLLRQSVLQAEHFGAGDIRLAQSLAEMGKLLTIRRRWKEAEEVLERELYVRDISAQANDKDTIAAMGSLIKFYLQYGTASKAEPMTKTLLDFVEGKMREPLDFSKKGGKVVLQKGQTLDAWAGLADPGVRDPLLEWSITCDSLGNFYRYRRNYALADRLYKAALDIKATVLGKDHLSLANSYDSLGVLCMERKEYKEAESYFRDALTTTERVLEPNSPEVYNRLEKLAKCLVKEGKYSEAEAFYLHAQQTYWKKAPSKGGDEARCMFALGCMYVDSGRPGAAIPVLTRALHMSERINGYSSIALVPYLRELGIAYWNSGQHGAHANVAGRANAIAADFYPPPAPAPVAGKGGTGPATPSLKPLPEVSRPPDALVEAPDPATKTARIAEASVAVDVPGSPSGVDAGGNTDATKSGDGKDAAQSGDAKSGDGKTADRKGTKPADAKDAKPADAKGAKSGDAKGVKTADAKGAKDVVADAKGAKGAKGAKIADAKGAKKAVKKPAKPPTLADAILALNLPTDTTRSGDTPAPGTVTALATAYDDVSPSDDNSPVTHASATTLSAPASASSSSAPAPSGSTATAPTGSQGTVTMASQGSASATSSTDIAQLPGDLQPVPARTQSGSDSPATATPPSGGARPPDGHSGSTTAAPATSLSTPAPSAAPVSQLGGSPASAPSGSAPLPGNGGATTAAAPASNLPSADPGVLLMERQKILEVLGQLQAGGVNVSPYIMPYLAIEQQVRENVPESDIAAAIDRLQRAASSQFKTMQHFREKQKQQQVKEGG